MDDDVVHCIRTVRPGLLFKNAHRVRVTRLAPRVDTCGGEVDVLGVVLAHDARLVQRLVDGDLAGTERAVALQDQRRLPGILIHRRAYFARTAVEERTRCSAASLHWRVWLAQLLVHAAVEREQISDIRL